LRGLLLKEGRGEKRGRDERGRRRREGRGGKRKEGRRGKGGGRGEEAFLVMWPKRLSALNPRLD